MADELNLEQLKTPAGMANMLAFLEYPRSEIIGALIENFPDCKAEEFAERALGEYEARERESLERMENYQRAVEEEHRGE